MMLGVVQGSSCADPNYTLGTNCVLKKLLLINIIWNLSCQPQDIHDTPDNYFNMESCYWSNTIIKKHLW